jgi:lipopolysaccharide export system protein LptA
VTDRGRPVRALGAANARKAWRSMGLGLLLLCIPTGAGGVEPGRWQQRKEATREPVEIRADSMELRRQENVALYTGNVLVTQPDYTLRSQLLEVRWDPETQKIHQLVARGSVHFQTEDARATCGVAVLDVANQALEMRDSPRLVQGGESMEGDRIIYSIPEKRSTVLGGQGGRVKTYVVPGGRQ